MAANAAATTDFSQSHANLVSALNRFLEERSLNDESAIGSILRTSFFKYRNAHICTLQEQGKSNAYIANRKSYLGKWRSLVLEIDRISAAQTGAASPFVAALRELLSGGFSQRGVAAQAGISLSTLKRWLSGAKPNERARPALVRLERFFGVVPGELISLTGLDVRQQNSLVAIQAVQIPYRQRLRAAAKDVYALKGVGDELRSQWAALLQYKTARTVFSKARQKNGRWTTTREAIERRTAINWYAFLGDSYVPTAAVRWPNVSQYLGWLKLPVPSGGRGYDDDKVQTLAHLVDCAALGEYIDWRIARAGEKVHAGIIGLLQFVKSLCHPKTGFFNQTPDLGRSISLDRSEWEVVCLSAHDFASANIASLLPQQEASRNSFEPLACILELANPLDAVADALQRMNAARPSTGGKSEAIWARDRLLLKILSSNPLRAKNLKFLTVSRDNKTPSFGGQGACCLYHSQCGWRIRVDRKFFKNASGAAKDSDYDMPVEPSVWSDIESYLRDYRPLLASPDNPYLFTSGTEGAEGVMYGLNRRVEALTKQYFWRCPGFGPHGFRHILATAILKKSPNDWTTAALVLHDRVETVQKHYAHLRSQDGAERQFAILAASYAKM